MKVPRIEQLIRAKQDIEQGVATPAKVWEIRTDGKGGFRRRSKNVNTFRRQQKRAWDKSIVATRQKLGMSQGSFAQMLGISVRTLHHWEQGTRTPSGAARILLRVAAQNPEAILKAAA